MADWCERPPHHQFCQNRLAVDVFRQFVEERFKPDRNFSGTFDYLIVVCLPGLRFVRLLA
jgi:hypothetical protein